MADASRSLPQGQPELDSALALVCSLPETERSGRRIDVQSTIAHAIESRELDEGVAFLFPNDDAIAQTLLDLALAERHCCAQFTYTIVFAPSHQPIELRVEATEPLITPLKDLYLGLARERDLGV